MVTRISGVRKLQLDRSVAISPPFHLREEESLALVRLNASQPLALSSSSSLYITSLEAPSFVRSRTVTVVNRISRTAKIKKEATGQFNYQISLPLFCLAIIA